MKDLRDDVFRERLVLDVHHGVVTLRVESISGGAEGSDVHGFKNLYQLPHRHFHALFIGFVGSVILQRAIQIVVDRQKLLCRFGPGVLIDVILFLCGALAEVIEFRRQPQVLVVFPGLRLLRFLQLGRLFLLFFLFPCLRLLRGFRGRRRDLRGFLLRRLRRFLRKIFLCFCQCLFLRLLLCLRQLALPEHPAQPLGKVT